MDIENIKIRLLAKYPFFGSIVVNCNFIEDKTVKTVVTSGKNIYYNPDFIELITEEEQLFVFAHNISHIAFNHEFRCKGRQKDLWDIATDAVINALLQKDGLSIPANEIFIPDAINYDAEALYEKLLAEKNANNSEQKNQNNQNNSNKSLSSIDGKKDENKFGIINDDENDKITNSGKKGAFEQNECDNDKQFKELQIWAVNYFLYTKRKANNIGVARSLVNWRSLLREVTRHDIDWSYRNASIEDGVLMPYIEKVETPETEILIDTSGSIDDELFRIFLKECKNILQNSKVKVGCFDIEFFGFTEIRNDNDIENIKFDGGRGTDFNVAINAFTGRVENKIILTDGYASRPLRPLDVIWLVYGDYKINPLGGKVIYMDANQLRESHNCVVKKKIK